MFCFRYIAFRCQALQAPENGTISYAPDSLSYDLGTVATYTCNPGFSLEGNLTRTCIRTEGNISTWNRQDESLTCTSNLPSTGNLPVIVGSTVGAVSLLIILIIITLLTIILIRRKLNHEGKIVEEDSIYEDPDKVLNNLPPLPSRNVRVNKNQAYEKTFEMEENKAYTSGQAPSVNESSAENYHSEDRMGPHVSESCFQQSSSADSIQSLNVDLSCTSGQAPTIESEMQTSRELSNDVPQDYLVPKVSASGVHCTDTIK